MYVDVSSGIRQNAVTATTQYFKNQRRGRYFRSTFEIKSYLTSNSIIFLEKAGNSIMQQTPQRQVKQKLLSQIPKLQQNNQNKLLSCTLAEFNMQRMYQSVAQIISSQLKNVSFLTVTKCGLRTFSNFPRLQRLRYLDVSRNQLLGNFRPLFIYHGSLRYINVSFNYIHKIQNFQSLGVFNGIKVYAKNNSFCDNKTNAEIAKIKKKLNKYKITFLEVALPRSNNQQNTKIQDGLPQNTVAKVKVEEQKCNGTNLVFNFKPLQMNFDQSLIKVQQNEEGGSEDKLDLGLYSIIDNKPQKRKPNIGRQWSNQQNLLSWMPPSISGINSQEKQQQYSEQYSDSDSQNEQLRKRFNKPQVQKLMQDYSELSQVQQDQDQSQAQNQGQDQEQGSNQSENSKQSQEQNQQQDEKQSQVVQGVQIKLEPIVKQQIIQNNENQGLQEQQQEQAQSQNQSQKQEKDQDQDQDEPQGQAYAEQNNQIKKQQPFQNGVQDQIHQQDKNVQQQRNQISSFDRYWRQQKQKLKDVQALLQKYEKLMSQKRERNSSQSVEVLPAVKISNTDEQPAQNNQSQHDPIIDDSQKVVEQKNVTHLTYEQNIQGQEIKVQCQKLYQQKKE